MGLKAVRAGVIAGWIRAMRARRETRCRDAVCDFSRKGCEPCFTAFGQRTRQSKTLIR